MKKKTFLKGILIVAAAAFAVYLGAYYYVADVHKNKLCRTLDSLTREQVVQVSLLSQNAELAVLEDEDEVEEILNLVRQIDAYGTGTEDWRGRAGGTVPAAFYIELKDGTSFYVGNDGVIDWLEYKMHSDVSVSREIGHLYWRLYNKYSVPWTEVRLKVRIEPVEGTRTGKQAAFIVYNDSYHDIYIDGTFRVTALNESGGLYSVDKTKAEKIGYRSQREITLDWSEQTGVPEGDLKVTFYYTTEHAYFGAYATCELKK